MNRNTYTYIYVLACFFYLFASCSSNIEHDGYIILKAESVIAKHPDSALLLIQSIDNPQYLSNKQRANYNLLLAQAKYENNIDIYNDSTINESTINESINYFLKENDEQKLALAYYYRSKVYFETNKEVGDAEKALLDCLEAKKYAGKFKNNVFLGAIHREIGDIYYAKYHFDEALKNFKSAQQYYLKENLKRKEIFMYGKIASAYNNINQYDSALVNNKQALAYVLAENNLSRYDSSIISSLHKNIGYSYGKKGDYESEKNELLKAYHTVPSKNGTDFNIIIFSLTNAFLKLNLPDSAIYYSSKFTKEENETAREKALQAHNWYKLHKTKGDYEVALKNLELLVIQNDIIYSEELSKSILEIQKKYDKEVIENQYNQVLVQRLYLVIIVIVTVLLAVLAIWFFMFKIKKKENELLEVKQSLYTLQQMLSGQEEKEERLKLLLMEKMDMARKVAQMSVVQTDNDEVFVKRYRKLFGKNLMDEIDWKNLYATINNLYDGFIDKINSKYPSLSEKDMQLCCFIRSGFKPDEISVLLSYTQNTVRVKKSKLGQKMGFNNYDSFLSYIMCI